MQFDKLDEKDVLVMKMLHYFIIKEDYNPIIIKGVQDEIWLENKNKDYSIIRLVTGHIHNNEQLNYDLMKTKHIFKQIKRKSFDFSSNILSIYTDTDYVNNIEDTNDKRYTNIIINDEKKLINDKILNDKFKDIKENIDFDEKNFDLITKITKDISNKNKKENEKREKFMKNKKPLFTPILILINILVFSFMYIYGNGSEDLNTLVKFGANYIPRVLNGEYYRLITSAFLHIGVLHLVFNMYALYVSGTEIEYIYGRIKFIFIYLFSAIMGSLFTVTLSSSNVVAAGASGAIFGLFGSLLYFGYNYRGYIGNSLVSQILPVVILNLLLGFNNPNIGNAAHIGGLIGGYIISMALGYDNENKTKQIHGTIISILLTIFMIYTSFIA